MERLIRISNETVRRTPMEFQRYIANDISWDDKLIGISGARGSGKTVLLLQHLKSLKAIDKGLYVSLDDVYFTENKLIYFAEDFHRKGGTHLFLDEVHKYPNWSQELKNIYDTISDLNVVFTSSSALEIHKGTHDLSRRAMVFHLAGLSFREFLELKYHLKLPTLLLTDILNNHNEQSAKIIGQIKPFSYFDEYLREGYYPFFKSTGTNYLKQLINTVNLVVETDLPAIHNIDFNAILKIKKLIAVLSKIVPYKPNIEKLAAQTGTTRETLLKYLYYLDKAQVIQWLGTDATGINYLNKPEKLYLGNTNMAYAFGGVLTEKGNIRETFFLSQLTVMHSVTYPKVGDFLIDNKFLFEIGGKTKNRKQIAGIENSFIAADDIEYGYQNKIPLWLFGFLY